jgi:hypothetical protein
MCKKILKAIAGSKDTPIQLGNVVLECYVLEDSTRVFSGNGLQKALEFSSLSGGTALVKMLNTGALKNIITDEIKYKIENRKEFTRPGAGGKLSKTYGYDVTLLIDICDLLIEGKNQNLLTERQKKYAIVSELIIRSVAKVGIISLVDEATGYQYDREKDELQKILGFYISEEKREWEKTFPDELYKQFFRLNGWDYTVNGIKKRPGVIGTWTNQYIYDQLPLGVKEELKNKVTKSNNENDVERMHSYLTEEGVEHLKNQIRDTIPLMRIADTFADFKYLFKKSIDRQKGQYELPFDLDDNGHIIEEIDISTLSKHNKSLKKALNFSPNKKEHKQESLF